MGACLAPCCGHIGKDAYREIINEVVLFLKGRTPQLIQKMKSEMKAAADKRDYEKAAELRDRIFALEKTLEKQIVVTSDFMDRDVFAVASASLSVITMLTVRNGFLRGTRTFHIPETMASETELLESFIRQYYEKHHFIPPEILVSIPLDSSNLTEDFLKGIKGKKVIIRFPQRGEKKKLVEMADRNAKTSLAEQMAAEATATRLLERIQKRLHLARFPEHIECFDVSNTAGTVPVAGVAVFKNGKPEKSLYRHYNVHHVSGPDDYAAMSEILHRRFRKKDSPEPFPDLLMVDGGKGQLNIAVAVLKELNIFEQFDTIAIAKQDELRGDESDKIFLPQRANPVHFGKEQDLLLFLQKIRDESHRFAVSFHRKKRKQTFMASALDDIPGIGKKRKETLLRHFGSIKKIRAASPEEISELPGMNRKTAESILDKLGSA
jgi:excinuclease ABC subunit C